jgi:hypothetical protein
MRGASQAFQTAGGSQRYHPAPYNDTVANAVRGASGSNPPCNVTTRARFSVFYTGARKVWALFGFARVCRYTPDRQMHWYY